MSLKTTKISDIEIKPVKVSNVNENILGADLFDLQYCKVFLAASSSGGKTTTLYNILKHRVNKTCKLFIFSSSHYNDLVWQEIKKLLDKKKCEVVYYTDLINNGVNTVKALIQSIMELKKEEEEEADEEPDKPHYELIDDVVVKMKSEKERKPKEPKLKAAEHIIIFDDQAGVLRDPSIGVMLKSARHYRIACYILSQDLIDLSPTALQQLDYLMIYGNIPTERLEHIWRHSGLNITFDKWLSMYHEATKERYSFFYVNRRSKDPDYRINFSRQFIMN